MYFTFGIVIKNDNNEKILPITDEIFSPDISVLEQQIIRNAYPDSSFSFIQSLVESRKISELKMYPSIYVSNPELSTEIDPLIDFLVDNGQATGVNNKISSKLLGDVVFNQVNELMQKGTSLVIKNKVPIAQNITKRKVKLNNNDSVKIIVLDLTLKLFMNTAMYVSIYPDNPDELLIDTIMKKSIYFKTTDISNLKVGYKLKIMEVDLENNVFNTIMSAKPEVLPIQLRRNVVKQLQIPVDVFLANIVDAGISAVNPVYQKKILINTKRIKLKNS